MVTTRAANAGLATLVAQNLAGQAAAKVAIEQIETGGASPDHLFDVLRKILAQSGDAGLRGAARIIQKTTIERQLA